MKIFMKRISRLAAVLMLAVLLVITSGCTGEDTPEGSEIDISAIENESSGSESENPESSENSSAQSGSEAENGENSQSGGETKADFIIKTPYCDLCYPGVWAPFLETEVSEEDGYRVDFTAKLDSEKSVELFAIIFGGSYDSIGTVKDADGNNISVSIEINQFSPDDSWSADEINIVFSMMDALNDVIAKMPIEIAEEEEPSEESGSSESEASRPGTSELSPEMAADMALDTPYGELHYPSAWSDYLSLNFAENGKIYTVEFSCKMDDRVMPLFKVHLGGSEGSEVGKIKLETGESVSVRISVSELSFDESWTAEEKNIAYAMQEDLNYLISKLG